MLNLMVVMAWLGFQTAAITPPNNAIQAGIAIIKRSGGFISMLKVNYIVKRGHASRRTAYFSPAFSSHIRHSPKSIRPPKGAP